MISAFNDFNEHMAVMPAKSDNCNGTSEEIWTDEEGNTDPYMYWNMTVDFIEKLRKQNDES